QEGHARLNFHNGESATHAERPFLPFAQGGFQTPSGKAELANPMLAAQGLDPVAEFIRPEEPRHSDKNRGFPLELLARKADNFLTSTISNVPPEQIMEDPGLLEIHPND